ncbi:DUF6804 family protein [Chryseobacterium sp. FH1]|uniref:DUF6804 family protein n=1 Tax=Chryseobacterium sp. FH1 TaxID=1233951 RepID=UPI0006916D12|nr:DUF6804 family protein [Chryseobacterium sp. FH1]
MIQLLKLILAGILLLCFFKMPYFFYRLSGYLLFAGFGRLAYDAFQRRDHLDVKIFVFLTLLYNPFYSLPLPHTLWTTTNGLVIVGLIIHLLVSDESSQNPDQFTKKDDH